MLALPPPLSGENIDRCIISWVVNVFSIENLFSIYLEYFNLFSIYLEYLILILNPFYAFETTFTAESSTLEDLAFKTTIDISSWQKSWKYIRHAVKWLDPRFCSSSHSHFSPLVHAAFDLMASNKFSLPSQILALNYQTFKSRFTRLKSVMLRQQTSGTHGSRKYTGKNNGEIQTMEFAIAH